MSARQLRAFAHATMNLDLDEMIEAGVIDATCTQGNTAWTKWNADAPMFIVKLSEKRLEALATLIATKWDGVFSVERVEKKTPEQITALQDIDQLAPGFSHGLSGRAEQ